MDEAVKGLSEMAEWGLGLDIPIRREQRISRGILEHLCQLVLHYTGKNDLGAPQICSILELVLRRPDGVITDSGLHALIVGAFLPVRQISLVFDAEREGDIWGYPCYSVRDIEVLSRGLLEIRAEELIVFRFLAGDRNSIFSRLESLQPAPLRLSQLSIFGALTAIPEVMHPVVSYSSSHQSLEIVGNRSILAESAMNALRVYIA